MLPGDSLDEILLLANTFLPYEDNSERARRLAIMKKDQLSLPLHEEIKNSAYQQFLVFILEDNNKIAALNKSEPSGETSCVDWVLSRWNRLDVPRTYYRFTQILMDANAPDAMKNLAIAFLNAQCQWGAPWAIRILQELAIHPSVSQSTKAELAKLETLRPAEHLLTTADPEELLATSL